MYDQTAEKILPRDSYKGRGTGGKEVTNKLRLCAAYLLHQLGKDHNTWSLSVRPGFQPIYINWSSFRFVIFFYAIGNNSTFIVVCFDYICVNIGYFSLEEALSKVPQKLHKAKRRRPWTTPTRV